MKGVFSRTTDLASASYAMLKRDKALMALPAMGLAASAAVVGINWVLVNLATTGLNAGTVDEPGKWGTEPIVWMGGIATALLICFVSVFFAAALTYGAWERFRGNKPTITMCLSAARDRLPVIVPWSLLSGTIGLLPALARNLEEGLKHLPFFIGPALKLFADIFNMVWGFVTFLVLPILVVEETGPIASAKRSLELFRKTWGKSIIFQVAFGLIGLLAAIPGLILGGIFAAAGAVIVGIVIGAAWLLLVIVAMATLIGIFKMALYLYATTGEVPGEFRYTGLENAFASRKTLKADRKARRAQRKALGARWWNLWTLPEKYIETHPELYYNDHKLYYRSQSSSEGETRDPPTT